MRTKTRVHQILEATEEGDKAASVVMVLITSLILISLVSIIIESVAYLNEEYKEILYTTELVIVAVFTCEYVLRIWSCTEDPRYSRPVVGRLRYAVSLLALFDLLAILPFYLPFVVAFDSRFLRSLRLLRVVRVTKITRYSESFDTLSRVLRRQKEALLVTFATILILIMIASCLIWYVETDVQPDKFASIPDSMWWTVITITTVGYGDVVPITPWGKVLGACVALLGVAVIAVPAGIIVTGFIDERNERLGQDNRKIKAVEKKVELLEKLSKLKESRVITEEEFNQQKKELLQMPTARPGKTCKSER